MGSGYRDGHRYEFVIVGSGMGGAIVARELAGAGREVLVLEAGPPPGHVGTFADALRLYDGNAITRTPRRSVEGTIIYRALAAGGSTVVSCGNAVRCLEHELAERGIELADDMAAIESEMGVALVPEDKLSDMGTRIRRAADSLGYTFGAMPKMVDHTRCSACGSCVLGCAHDAKWTALRPLAEAVDHGAEVLYGAHVERALRRSGGVDGVSGHTSEGELSVRADVVILSAGGLGTPVILAASGIENAGTGLFIDAFVNVYGSTQDPLDSVEPQMSLVDPEFHAERGFLMSPFINYARGTRMVESGTALAARSVRHSLGMMVKTTDDPTGRVLADGTVHKPLSTADRRRLDEGSATAAEILVAAGAKPDSIIVSKPQGAHPGGTAAVGVVVDADLQTDIDGLFVVDASVLPETPGLPPLVTIGALARRLGRSLVAASM